jgi:diguanylate cyclase (GGDEF)-like protein/PAS domain S-box-containing protein
MASRSVIAAPAAERVPAILLVDDDHDRRAVMRAMLAPLGHRVVEAHSGHAALQAVTTYAFAMILIDVRMHGPDGYETARLCRTRGRAEDTPIVFVTEPGDDRTGAVGTYRSGAVDFISTPVVAEVLRAKATAFVELSVKSRELHRSLESIATLGAALRESEARAQSVLDNVADGVLILDEAGVIESVNESANRLFSYRAGDLVGKPLRVLIAPQRASAAKGLEAALAALRRRHATRAQAIETLGRRGDGSVFAMEIEGSDMQSGSRRTTLLCIRDISERRAHTKALEHQALHDALTGLPNRALLTERMSRVLTGAARSQESRAVLVVDLDGFKEINDTLGHDRGDALLRQIAEQLSATVHETDTVARLGGDEFGVLSGRACDFIGAASMAREIYAMCERGFLVDEEPVRMRASIGIAMYPEHGSTTEQLLHRADLAMYLAKRSGNHYAVYDAAQELLEVNQLALMLDLRECVTREQLVLHYQPKVDLLAGEIDGVEALVRWRHPTRGLLQPGAFMPEVERCELIAPVTRWVLDTALRQQREWRREGIDLCMAVNVSARSLRSGSGLPEVVAELTDRWATPAERLTLELTEGALIEAAAPSVLARLHAMGERLSIDDFGTGYSSLAYLQRLPVDELKVDRSFVTGLATGSDDAIIVRSTIDLAHNLGLRVVAEGVEEERVMRTLLEYGCDAAQGYLLGRPVPAEEIPRRLERAPYVLGDAS